MFLAFEQLGTILVREINARHPGIKVHRSGEQECVVFDVPRPGETELGPVQDDLLPSSHDAMPCASFIINSCPSGVTCVSGVLSTSASRTRSFFVEICSR